MYFTIDDKSGEVLIPRMKNWVKLQEIIRSSDLLNNRIKYIAHQAVKYKLEAAYMHIAMLNQSYKIRETTPAKLGSTG